MPLSDMYRTMLEATNPATWETNRQKQLMGEYELESKRRAMDAEQRLRELYSSGGPVSTEKVMSIDPELGIKLQQSQFKNMLEAGQIEKLNREKDEAESKVYAQHLSGPAQDYFDDIKKGMTEQQADYKFRSAVGKTQAEIEQRYGIKPKVDFTQFSPLQIANRIHSLGVDIPHLKELEAQQQSQLQIQQKQVPSYGDIKPTWDSARGQWISTPQTQAPSFSGASAEELNMIEKSLPGMPEGPDKEGLKRFLAEKKGMPQAQTPTGLIPLADVKAQEAGATKTAQLTAEEEVADRKAVDSYFRGRPPEEVRDLIKSSIEGDVETGLARIGKALGVSVPGGAPTAALQVITQQLASSLPFSPGSQSDAEFRARLMKIGDPASNEPIENRLAALDEFYRDQEAFITQKWKPESMESILDMRKQGFISEDNARKVFKRFKQSKSGAM